MFRACSELVRLQALINYRAAHAEQLWTCLNQPEEVLENYFTSSTGPEKDEMNDDSEDDSGYCTLSYKGNAIQSRPVH